MVWVEVEVGGAVTRTVGDFISVFMGGFTSMVRRGPRGLPPRRIKREVERRGEVRKGVKARVVVRRRRGRREVI